MLKIGNLKLSHPYILAPLASIGDLPFRTISRKFGCELAYVEMLNARSVCYESKKTQELLTPGEGDRPLGAQLLGCEEDYIKRALEIVEKYKFDTLDFNSACPKKKVVTRGEGAALMKDPKKLGKLLKVAVKNSKIPVTVKIRTGWDKHSISAREVALGAEDSGVKAIFIHGRTRAEDYSGEVDYNAIKSVKDAVKIPVIGSGNVFSSELAKKMFDETGCDGILVARGALGNPWIFKQIDYFLKYGKNLPGPEKKEVIETIIKHLKLCVNFHGERNGVLIFRKFFCWYTSGFKNIRPLRLKVCLAKKEKDVIKIIEKLNPDM